jgi:hypothetical protein
MAIGCTIHDLRDPLDLLIGFRGLNLLLEIKLPRRKKGGTSHSRLNSKQKEFFQLWHGQRAVVREPADAVEYVLAYAAAVLSGRGAGSIDHPTD